MFKRTLHLVDNVGMIQISMVVLAIQARFNDFKPSEREKFLPAQKKFALNFFITKFFVLFNLNVVLFIFIRRGKQRATVEGINIELLTVSFVLKMLVLSRRNCK